MKCFGLLMLLLVAVGSAAAFDLGNRAPAKPEVAVTPPPPDPVLLRQGGDTILSAVPITLPIFDLAGTTAGYVDDYDEACPYPWSTSPEVVYTFVPDHTRSIYVDLFGSSYDTKVYIYDENLYLIACNDDYYPDYTSLLQWVSVVAGVQYYLVIDGYGGAYGEYILNIDDELWWIPPCPEDAQLENEPPLEVDYVDLWNGGCFTDPADPPFQNLTGPVFCGVSGWYTYQGVEYRDTDWFTLQIPAGGYLEIEGYAWRGCYMFVLEPQDCGSVGVAQSLMIGPGIYDATMGITGEPEATVWFWVGPTTFQAPDGEAVYEFDYLLELSLPVAVVPRSWSSVKALFD